MTGRALSLKGFALVDVDLDGIEPLIGAALRHLTMKLRYLHRSTADLGRLVCAAFASLSSLDVMLNLYNYDTAICA